MSEKVSKKVKQGKIDIDPEQCALVVNFEIEVLSSGNGGRAEVLDRTSEVRRIKIKSLAPDKNLAQMAEDIVDKCKYIHPSRVEEVEQLLIKLRKIMNESETKAKEEQKASDSVAESGPRGSKTKENSNAEKDRELDICDKKKKKKTTDESNMKEKTDAKHLGGNVDKDNKYLMEELEIDRQERLKALADEQLPPSKMDDMDNYLEMLYQVSGKTEKEKEEGLRMQIRGVGMILQLCRDVINLESLIQNSTVMGALTRVLQDDHKKSIDLSFNILRIFLAFSNFVEMHGIMANYRIGILSMKVIEYELKRIELRELEKKAIEDKMEADVRQARENNQNVSEIIERNKRLRARETVKGKRLQSKQDKLLFVAFYILINLAEDISVERKMTKKNLLEFLDSMLDRGYSDLLLLTVTFLKKLSVFDENKEAFKNSNILPKIIKFLTCSSVPLVNATLRLMFNLSFDTEFRDRMIKHGIIPKLVNLLKTPSFRAKTLKLLYHLSVEDRCKSMITYTDGVNILMGMVVNFPQPLLAKELAAVMVNLSYNTRNVELIIGNRGLNYLMDRLSSTRDPLLLKIIRNVSLWTFNQQQELESPETQYRYRGLWSPHIKVLFEMINDRENHDLLVEALGCLSNLTALDIPSTYSWIKMLREHGLMSVISKLLVPGMAQNDVILEVILLIGSMASDPQVCEIFASSNIVNLLYQVWKDRSDDVEIMLQLINCFYKMLFVEASREEVMYSTRIVVDVVECLIHKNKAVRTLADKFCETVLELDRKPSGDLGQLGSQIRKKLFESHNSAWVSAFSDTFVEFDNHVQDHDDLINIGGKGVASGFGYPMGVNMELNYADESKMGYQNDTHLDAKNAPYDMSMIDYHNNVAAPRYDHYSNSPSDKEESWEDSGQWNGRGQDYK